MVLVLAEPYHQLLRFASSVYSLRAHMLILLVLWTLARPQLRNLFKLSRQGFFQNVFGDNAQVRERRSQAFCGCVLPTNTWPPTEPKTLQLSASGPRNLQTSNSAR